MFFKKIKLIFISIMLLTMPINALAYSNYIYASGKSIGINIKLKGIMVVGLYEVNGVSPGVIAKINLGDRIIKVNNNKVNSIKEMTDAISKSNNKDSVEITYLRNNKEYKTNLELINDNGIYKTGLYVKDTISGVGTLTYIDPGTMMYGALGHEIIDKNTKTIVDIDDGKIFKSSVTGITKSTNGNPGSKNALYYNDVVYGNINKNTHSGIFGNFSANTDNLKLYKVSNPVLGDAKILTVIDSDTIKEYSINITKINEFKETKNILFDITDTELLNKTGGIVQGMSGSPIIQGDNIVGSVTHVVVDNPEKGYGIYITNMLTEAEK
ncbi:MAG: SpoIVB peptidase [bacterium]|nr:SpoIVB peptidase [bacterium]MDY4108541.1 SpoIVB peptidase [Bacilli bacterium]